MTAGPNPERGSGEADYFPRKVMQLHKRVLLKIMESRHMPIQELEAQSAWGGCGMSESQSVSRLLIVLNPSSRINAAEKNHSANTLLPHTFPKALVLSEPARGEPSGLSIDLHSPHI